MCHVDLAALFFIRSSFFWCNLCHLSRGSHCLPRPICIMFSTERKIVEASEQCGVIGNKTDEVWGPRRGGVMGDRILPQLKSIVYFFTVHNNSGSLRLLLICSI